MPNSTCRKIIATAAEDDEGGEPIRASVLLYGAQLLADQRMTDSGKMQRAHQV
jgi:hypothetical protein